MTRLRPGSAAWLVAHDIRLAWRDLRARTGKLGSPAMAMAILAVLAVIHAVAWPLGWALADGPADDAHVADLAGGVAAFALLLMVAQTLNGATKLLYARGDLDLLLASPLPPRRVLGARAVAVAAGAFGSAALFLLPIADVAALQGHAGLLALYPALAGAALLAAAGGLLLAMGLFRLIGPARTRVAAQILAGLIGATFTILLQLRRYWPDAGGLPAIPRDGPLHDLLALPVRAAFGDGAALAAWLGLSLAAFAAAALGLGPAFASDAARAAGAATSPRRPRRARDPARAFGGTALAQLRSKERLVILRDPWLLSQVMLQILYMLPMGAVLWTGSDDIGLALAPTISVIAFQMSSSLAWLSLSGEDAPDLLATAPLPRGALLRAKFRAVGTLVSAALGLPWLWLAVEAPRVALETLGLSAAGLAVAVMLQLWRIRPAGRSKFYARYRESRLVAMAEMGLSMVIGLAAALMAQASLWSFVPLALVAGIAAWLFPRSRRAAARATMSAAS